MSSEWGWTEYSQEYKEYVDENNIDDINNYHVKDLIKQINAYKESIKLGHSVIVVAHSQGNLYTNEAYDALDDWIKDYFHMMGVASPADHVAGGGPHITFHNDIINLVPSSLSSNREDTNNEHNSVISYDAHDFYESYMKEKTTKSDIQNFIISKINEHKNASSQWIKDQEFDKGTKDYKITVKHLYDPNNISIGDTKIYPFNTTKKLYKVIDNTGGNGWVKASCGGSEVFDYWDGQKDHEIYKIKTFDIDEYIKKVTYKKIFIVRDWRYDSSRANVIFRESVYINGNAYYVNKIMAVKSKEECWYMSTFAGSSIFGTVDSNGVIEYTGKKVFSYKLECTFATNFWYDISLYRIP